MLLAITVAVVVALSLLTAIIMETMPPKQGFVTAVCGAFVIWTCAAVIVEGFIFSMIRLVRYAWGGAS